MTGVNVTVQAGRRVIVTRDPLQVVVQSGEHRIVRAGIQGPAGPPGAPGASGAAIVTAGIGGVNAFQIVIVTFDGRVQAANSSEPSHAGRVIGMTEAAIVEGASGSVRLFGPITNPAWSLEPGKPYFLAAGGGISVNIPATGFIQQIGIAKGATTLVINLGDPVKR